MIVTRNQIEIQIGDVCVVTKLDAIGALVAAVREAHRDTISPRSWAALNRAQEEIAEAIIHANDDKPVFTGRE